MLFKIGDTVYSPSDVPCAIVFKNDEEKKWLIDILNDMPPKGDDQRWFVSAPHGYFKSGKDADKWMDGVNAEKGVISKIK